MVHSLSRYLHRRFRQHHEPVVSFQVVDLSKFNYDQQ